MIKFFSIPESFFKLSPLNLSRTLLTSLIILASCQFSGKEDAYQEKPVHPLEINSGFVKKVAELHAEKDLSLSENYLSQMSNSRCNVQLPDIHSTPLTGEELYAKCKDQVLIFGKSFKCNTCPDWHLSKASAFPITSDGICVSNYHVFTRVKNSDTQPYKAAFIMDGNGTVYPVLEILAASKEDDLAIFRVECEPNTFQALPLATDGHIGQSVHLISHPDENFYRYSRGLINRVYHRYGSEIIRQSMSAEFAKGSSGAPILDDHGNVVGVVAGTQPVLLNYKTGEGLQMVINEIIPVSRVHELIN